MRTLIAYFSRAGENYFGGSIKNITVGNTEICANLIKEFLDADVFKIEMKNPYSNQYRECVAQAKIDFTENSRPELVKLPENMEAYDTIILGYPNYCGTIPMAVATFLESFDSSGKKILPFCTNEGSGMGKSEAMLKKLCPGADIAKGKSITGSQAKSSKAELEAWVKQSEL